MIQWFPGHMAKAKKEIQEKVKICDLAFVLLDARAPKSSYNPLIEEVVGNKPILYLLAKMDKADLSETKKWQATLEGKNRTSLLINSVRKTNINRIAKYANELLKEKRAKDAAKGLKPRPIRAMILGIPNVGKSTLINALVNKKVTTTGDRPGITKAQQWIKVNNDFELLDTPGVLWPKFDDQTTGYHLAITGAIKDDILPIEDVALYALQFLKEHYSNALDYYQIDTNLDPINIINELGHQKKMYRANQSVDREQVGRMILQDIRNGRLGKITWDRYDE